MQKEKIINHECHNWHKCLQQGEVKMILDKGKLR